MVESIRIQVKLNHLLEFLVNINHALPQLIHSFKPQTTGSTLLNRDFQRVFDLSWIFNQIMERFRFKKGQTEHVKMRITIRIRKFWIHKTS